MHHKPCQTALCVEFLLPAQAHFPKPDFHATPLSENPGTLFHLPYSCPNHRPLHPLSCKSDSLRILLRHIALDPLPIPILLSSNCCRVIKQPLRDLVIAQHARQEGELQDERRRGVCCIEEPSGIGGCGEGFGPCEDFVEGDGELFAVGQVQGGFFVGVGYICGGLGGGRQWSSVERRNHVAWFGQEVLAVLR